LKLADVPLPEPQAGEVRLRVHYAALNPADAYLAQGLYPAKPPLPHVLGRDGFGTVTAVGAGVTGLSLGDKRLVLRGDTGVERWGTFAEEVVVAANSLVEVPTGWTPEQAAGAPLVYLTAWQALTMWGELPAGAVVLVTGASGGVGVAATQLAKALGYTVVALSRSEAKRAELRALGADFTPDIADAAWPKNLLKTLAPRRVDLAVDNIGGEQFNQVLATLGQGGRISCVGRLAGPVPEFNTASIFFRRVRIGGVSAGDFTRPEAHAAWHAALAMLARTGARPLVDQVFPFNQLPQAFERLAAGPMGKVLLQVSPGENA